MNEAAKPFLMINYCLQQPNVSISFEELKANLNISGVSNIKESLKRTQFNKESPLIHFISVEPRSLKVSPIAHLSERQVDDIIGKGTIYSN